MSTDSIYNNAENDYDYKLFEEYEQLFDETEMGIRELGDLSTVVDLDALNLCNNQDEINGILANMKTSTPTSIEEMEEILDSMNNLLDPDF